jgi:hypothetical protein
MRPHQTMRAAQHFALPIAAMVAFPLTVITADGGKADARADNLFVKNDIALVPMDMEPKTIALMVPEYALDWIKFGDLVAQWKQNYESWRSFSGDLMRDPSFSRMVGMGPVAIPFILQEMRKDVDNSAILDNWFYALWVITGKNPIPPEARGKPREMANAWIEWSVNEGHIDASLGGAIPVSG